MDRENPVVDERGGGKCRNDESRSTTIARISSEFEASQNWTRPEFLRKSLAFVSAFFQIEKHLSVVRLEQFPNRSDQSESKHILCEN